MPKLKRAWRNTKYLFVLKYLTHLLFFVSRDLGLLCFVLGAIVFPVFLWKLATELTVAPIKKGIITLFGFFVIFDIIAFAWIYGIYNNKLKQNYK